MPAMDHASLGTAVHDHGDHYLRLAKIMANLQWLRSPSIHFDGNYRSATRLLFISSKQTFRLQRKFLHGLMCHELRSMIIGCYRSRLAMIQCISMTQAKLSTFEQPCSQMIFNELP